MGILLNGNKPSKIIYNGVEPSLYYNSSKIWPNTVPPPIINDYVTIGSQVWMSKNLEYDDNQGGIYTANIQMRDGVTADAYFYTHDAAIRVANTIPGWHLPTSAEFQTLINYAGPNKSAAGNNLKSRSGWEYGNNGYDAYGFNAFPEGACDREGPFSMTLLCTMATQNQKIVDNVLNNVYFCITNWGYGFDGAMISNEPASYLDGYNIRLIKD